MKTFVRTKSFLKSTDFKFEYRKIGIFLLGGILMCIVTRSLTSNLSSSILTNLIQFAIALPIYLTITTLFKANPFLDLLRKKIVFTSKLIIRTLFNKKVI